MSPRRSLTARMVALGGALAIVVGLALGTLLLTIADMRAAARTARMSAQVIAAADRAEKLVLDLETGARGFALTREERFLEPWRAARGALPDRTARLAALVAGDARRRALAEQIAAGVRDYVDEYSIPLVDAVRGRGARPSADEGKRRVDALRAQFARFGAREQRLADARRAASDAAARRAITVGAVVLVLGVALLLAFAAYLGRAVAGPVRRVALAADRLAAGDMSARVPVRGRDELARLAGSFNAMGESLQASRDELDGQTTELELQTAELEDQQQRLAAANEELRAQRDELERTTAALADETERQRLFGEFGEALAANADLDDRARTTLAMIAAEMGADVGALYARDDDGPCELVAALGLRRADLPERVEPGAGLAGRALAERARRQAGHDEAGLTVAAFGGEVTVRRELHVPLLYGERAVGVVSLGFIDAGGIDERSCELVEHLAGQASVALGNAFATRRARRLAEINRAVLDTVQDGILLTSDAGVVLANAPARRLPAEVAGLPLQEADEPAFDEVETDDGGRVFQRYSAPVRDAGGEHLGRTVVIREVTAEREAERLKNDLMATVSHELRTPLASIVGFTELLLMRDPDGATRRQALETVHGEARRLSELIDDFLDLQRIAERGRLPLERRRIDLGPLVADQARVFAAQSDSHTLDVRIPDDALVAECDPGRLKQVLANLLSNAIKYSPGGGRIAVEGWARDGVVGVAVADPGLGIPTAQQPRVFERFFRSSDATERAIGGTGLGLALAREIVEAHDGRIGFDSVEGEGSRFWFELPAAI